MARHHPHPQRCNHIAGYLAFRVRVPAVTLTLGLVVLLCVFGWGTHCATRGIHGQHAFPIPARITL
jgi:hypothetical protein